MTGSPQDAFKDLGFGIGFIQPTYIPKINSLNKYN